MEERSVKHRERILLVENDSLNIDVISKYLHGEYDFDVARNAKEAERLLFSNTYNLVLLDIHLGDGVGGLGLLKIIRASEQIKNILVIAITAFAALEQREQFIHAGCDDYMAKPFYRKDLLIVMRKNLDSRLS
ncbi:MAG: response regulator [Ignavibacteriaceae bacterium]|nr:response regulator [Ignavibacteriaceae bacterium]